ncbi:hypothetical protein FQN54_007714 [Arachnomyces sp. PD_36]|nr:hypothetical protein FQN54_007714 [Arachnomyces sp. PD_36]
MASYFSVPAIKELIHRVETKDPDAEDDQSDLKAMTLAILNHYFTAEKGFTIVPEQDSRGIHPDATIYHVKRIPSKPKKPLIGHIVAEAQYPDGPGHPRDAILRLKDKAEDSLAWFVQFSAVLFTPDASLIFYGDHRYIGEHTELKLLFPPRGRLVRYELNLRSDAEKVHSVLEYIANGAVRSPDLVKLIKHNLRDSQKCVSELSGLPGLQ